jgi:hypothetical protein
MANELIPFGMAIEEITKDLNEAIKPFAEALKAAGATDEEVRLEIERALFDSFRGLHRFPDSERP